MPLRPVGHQTKEVVLDNTGPVSGDGTRLLAGKGTVQFGEWTDSTSSVYFGPTGTTPFRAAGTAATQTAHARYTPDIQEAGFYPIYAWVSADATWRTSDQRYSIHYAGGQTDVSINHRMVGGGFVYLGTYFFEEGTSGYVDIGNQSQDLREEARVVADAIRFGNGMGDIDRGGESLNFRERMKRVCTGSNRSWAKGLPHPRIASPVSTRWPTTLSH